ncbi:MAG: PD40 domain-containing protein [Gemmatimonadota bacterium]|nr:MAG: PD40 domain-containing protein [Gemmatimonadota bacterium]
MDVHRFSAAWYSIASMNIDGSHRVRLSETPYQENHVHVSPDGTKILFSRFTEDLNGDGNINEDDAFSSEIGIRNIDGSEPQLLTDNDNIIDAVPVWSPEGDRILFASSRNSPPGGLDLDLFIMDVNGENIVNLTNTPDTLEADPHWVGGTIVFKKEVLSDPTMTSGVWLMNDDGTNQRQLTFPRIPGISTGPFRFGDFDPKISPDGTRVAFYRHVNDIGNYGLGDWDLYVIDIDGDDEIEISRNDVVDIMPAWSPDGTKLVFWVISEDLRDIGDIYVVNPDGSDRHKVTPEPEFSFEEQPDWYPWAGTTEIDSLPDIIFTLEVVPGEDTAPPATPKIRQFVPGEGTLTVFWYPNSDPDMFFYALFRKGQGEPDFQFLDFSFWPAYRDTGLSNGLIYEYTVTAMDTAGNFSSSSDSHGASPGIDVELTGKMVFTSNRDDPLDEFYLMNMDGSHISRLTYNTYHEELPDVFVRKEGGQSKIVSKSELLEPASEVRVTFTRELNPGDVFSWEVFDLDVASGEERRLTSNSVIDGHSSWSPDGSQMLFVSWMDGDDEIYIMEPKTGEVVDTLTRNENIIDNDPEFSPDGSKIVFKSDRDTGREQLYIMDITDGQGPVERLTYNENSDHDPVWSPDGRYVAFERYLGPGDWFQEGLLRGPWAVYVIDVETLTETAVTDTADTTTIAWLPVWSPDGSKIAYIQFCGDENMDIFVANMDGSHPVNVTNHPAMDTFFDWFHSESMKGDVNDDTRIDLLDVLLCVNIILGLHQPDSGEFWRADYNDDGEIDILDIVGIVRVILEG